MTPGDLLLWQEHFGLKEIERQDAERKAKQDAKRKGR